MKTSVKTLIAVISLCLCSALFAACSAAPANAPAAPSGSSGNVPAPAVSSGSAAVPAAPAVSSSAAEASGTTEPEEPSNPVIGKAAEGEMIKKVSLMNLTGQDITGFAMTYSGKEKFGKNMLPKGETYKSDEVRDLYYDITEAMEKNTGGKTGTAGSSGGAIVYSAQVTFADGTKAVLSDLPFNEFEQGRLLYQNGVLFLEYVSPYTNEDIVTRAQEESAKKAADKAAAKKEAAKAAEEAAKAAEEASRVAEEQAAAWAAQQQAALQQQQYYAPEPQNNADAGCVGNSGLVY